MTNPIISSFWGILAIIYATIGVALLLKHLKMLVYTRRYPLVSLFFIALLSIVIFVCVVEAAHSFNQLENLLVLIYNLV